MDRRGDQVMGLALAGSIALDATASDRASYSSETAILRALAVDCLPLAADDSAFVQLHQTILGFDGDEVWGKELDHLNDGEVDVECPECFEETLLDLTDEESGIQPGLSCELAEHLHADALAAGRASVATGLTRLFGRITCENCDTPFNVADHVAGASYP